MVRGTIGSYDLYRLEANASGPLGNSGLGYRATFATTDGGGPRKFDYNKELFLGSTLMYKLTGTSSIQFDWSYTQKDEIVSFTGVDSTGKLARLPGDFSLFEPWVYGKSYYQYASLTYRAAITPSFQLQMVANYNRGNNDWDRVTPIGRPNPTTGMMQRNFQELFYDDRAVNQLTDFLHSFRTGSVEHKFSYGWAISQGVSGPNNVTTVRIADLNVNNPAYNTPKPGFNRTPGNMTRPLNGSAYIQEQISLFNGKVIGVAGYRYNRFHSTSLSQATNVTTERNDQKGIKRYGLIFKPASWASIYYNYSESFVFNNGLIQGGPRDGQLMIPSVGENKEVGVKVETSDGRYFASVAYFDLSLTNVRILVTMPPGSVNRFGVPLPGNLAILQEGKETNKGAFEADIGMSLPSPLGPVQGILTWYHGDQKNATGLLPNSVVNSTWSALVSQEVNQGKAKGLKFGAGAYYRGDAVGVGPATGTPTAYTQPAYTTTTGFVSYNTGRYRFALNIDNLFDKKDMIEGGETDFWLYVNPGRTFKFSVDYRF
jgi:iron complex outermembrane receptor protein